LTGDQDHEPYRKAIWEKQESDVSQFGELEDVPPAVPAAANEDFKKVFPNAVELCQAGPGQGCRCGKEHKYEQGNIGAAIREVMKEIAEEAAETVAEKSIPAVLVASELAPDETELAKGMLNERTLTLVTQRADTVQIKKLMWLWLDRIPAGKITLLVGKQDCGKSLAALDIVARVTSGAEWPDGAKNDNGPREVVVGTTEDDLATTLVPRLKAAGANLERVHLVKRVVVEGKKIEGKKGQDSPAHAGTEGRCSSH
jgi:hypothetical protein